MYDFSISNFCQEFQNEVSQIISSTDFGSSQRTKQKRWLANTKLIQKKKKKQQHHFVKSTTSKQKTHSLQKENVENATDPATTWQYAKLIQNARYVAAKKKQGAYVLAQGQIMSLTKGTKANDHMSTESQKNSHRERPNTWTSTS